MKFNEQDQERIKQCLADNASAFTDMQKLLLIACVIEQMPVSQVAITLDLPTTSVQNQLNKTLYQCKKIMDDPEYLKANKILYSP